MTSSRRINGLLTPCACWAGLLNPGRWALNLEYDSPGSLFGSVIHVYRSNVAAGEDSLEYNKMYKTLRTKYLFNVHVLGTAIQIHKHFKYREAQLKVGAFYAPFINK